MCVYVLFSSEHGCVPVISKSTCHVFFGSFLAHFFVTLCVFLRVGVWQFVVFLSMDVWQFVVFLST